MIPISELFNNNSESIPDSIATKLNMTAETAIKRNPNT
jgi:hypothetical protein